MKHWGGRTGLAALYIFCLGAFLAAAPASIGMGLLVLALPFAVADWRALLRQPAVLAALLLAGYILLQTGLSVWRSPDLADHLWAGAGDWLRLLLFIPFAFFLGADPQRLDRLLLLVLAGLIGGMLLHLDWGLLLSRPDRFFRVRTGYGYGAIAFALYSGAALLGLVLLARRWWGEPAGSAARVWRGLLWLLSLAVLLQGLIQSYSRGTWIAFALALTTGLWLSRRQARRSGAPARTPRLVLALGVAALAVIVALNAERLAKRVTEELDSVGGVVSGETQDVSASSFGQRWHAQLFGLNAWLERPLLGWGAETSRPLMRTSGNAQVSIEGGDTLKHLHNTYLEILVQFGLIGLALFGLLIVLLGRGFARARREGRIPGDYGVYLIALLVLTLVWCLFDYRAVHQDWRIYWTLLAGTALSFALPAQALAQPRRPPETRQVLAAARDLVGRTP